MESASLREAFERVSGQSPWKGLKGTTRMTRRSEFISLGERLPCQLTIWMFLTRDLEQGRESSLIPVYSGSYSLSHLMRDEREQQAPSPPPHREQ